MHIRFVPAVLALQLAMTSTPAVAQTNTAASTTRQFQLQSIRRVDSRLYATAEPARPLVKLAPNLLPVPQAGDSHRTRNAIVGGVIGSAVGIGVCTGISSLMNDSASGGFSTCTVKGNLMFGVGGFAVGALVGAAVR